MIGRLDGLIYILESLGHSPSSLPSHISKCCTNAPWAHCWPSVQYAICFAHTYICVEFHSQILKICLILSATALGGLAISLNFGFEELQGIEGRSYSWTDSKLSTKANNWGCYISSPSSCFFLLTVTERCDIFPDVTFCFMTYQHVTTVLSCLEVSDGL